MKTCRK